MGQLMRRFIDTAILLMVISFVLLMVGGADASPFSTANHPLTSSMSFNIYLGDPNDNPGQAPLGSVGPGELTGTVEIDLNLDEMGDGTIQFLGSNLLTENLVGTFDLGPLGTLDYAYEDVVFSWDTPAYEVDDGAYMALLDTDVMLLWTAGTIVLGNATGPLADLVGTGVIFDLDYNARPLPVLWGDDPNGGFHGNADSGPGGFVDAAEVSLEIPEAIYPFQDIEDVGQFFIGYQASVFVATPEPSTIALATVGMLSAILCFLPRVSKA